MKIGQRIYHRRDKVYGIISSQEISDGEIISIIRWEDGYMGRETELDENEILVDWLDRPIKKEGKKCLKP